MTRLEQVNRLLSDLTQKMYSRSTALYRQVLATTYDRQFDDDVEVKGTMQFAYNGRGSVLEMGNDCVYGSDFHRMICIIDQISIGMQPIIAQCRIKVNLTNHPEKADTELKFEDECNDGISWQDSPFDNPVFAHIRICPALHRVCSHGLYSIPDLLRMNNFCCDVTVVHQHVVEQDGARTGWWNDYSFEAFADKLRAEAEHRPPHLRYGQFIYCRTMELFPDAANEIDPSADCFNDDTMVEKYLYNLYMQLHSNNKQSYTQVDDPASWM